MSSCVFIGDSITVGARVSAPSTVTSAQRFSYLISQERGLTEINKGVPSDNSTGMLSRFETDVVGNNPAWIAIMTGTNDSDDGQAYAVNISTYESNLRSMIERGLETGSEVVLLTPPISNSSNVKSHIAPYLQVLRKLSVYYKISLIDVHQLYAEKEHNSASEFSTWLMDDWHPSVSGHAAIASLIDLPQYQNTFRIDNSVPWVIVASSSGAPYESNGWNGYTVVQTISSAQLTNTGLNNVRVTFRSGQSEGLSIGKAYIGHTAASGASYGFEQNPVQLLFNGKVSAAVSGINTEFQASADFTIVSGKSLVIAFLPNNSSLDAGAQSQSQSGWQAYWKFGDDVITTAKSGYTVGNKIDMVVKVEAR